MSNDQEQTTESGHDEEETAAIRVECYAGHRAEESPRRFFIGKHKIDSHFKVRGDDGSIYILRYDLDSDSWEMTLFNSGTRDETRLSST